MRPIDADKFEEFIRKNCSDSLVDLWCELVRRQPTIEAVPVDRNKIIDELAKEVLHEFTVLELHDRCPTVTDCKVILRDVAEKMKGGAD